MQNIVAQRDANHFFNEIWNLTSEISDECPLKWCSIKKS